MAMHTQENGPHFARWPWLLSLMTALAGVAITFYVWSRAAERERLSAAETFRLEADVMRQNVEREIGRFMEVLDSIRMLHTLSGQISQEAFEEFVQKGMLHQQRVLGAFGFAQRITHDVREVIEQAHRADSDDGYVVVEYGPDGTLRPVDRRETYFPVTWQNDAESLGVPVGYDLGTRPGARLAIERMQAHGRMALSDDRLMDPESGGAGYLVLAPILYHTIDDASAGYLMGAAVAVFEPYKVIAQALAGAPRARMSVSLYPGLTGFDPTADALDSEQWTYRHPVALADQAWLFECRAPVELTGRRSHLILAVGLLITALIASQMLFMAGRARRIEVEVRARTADLREAKDRLETEMRERMRIEQEFHEVATRERQRIGRDLHDSLGQKLTGAVFLSRSLLEEADETAAPGVEHLRKMNETLKSAVSEVRQMARGLAPVALGGENLGEALVQMAGELSDLYNVPCEVDLTGGLPDLEPGAMEHLYLIAQEAAHNAARHADAELIRVSLSKSGGGWELVVEDDGKGVPRRSEAEPGMGLRIMQLRAHMIGAGWRIEPRPGGGTRVVCRI